MVPEKVMNLSQFDIKQHFFVTDVMEDLYNYVNPLNKKHSPMISKETLDIVLENKDVSHRWPSIFLSFSFIMTVLLNDTIFLTAP